MQRARGWRGSTLGEYTLLRRWRFARAAARMYEARNTATGQPALVLQPRHPADWPVARSYWVARVCHGPELLAVEFTHPPTQADLPEVTLGLQRLAHTLAQVEDHPTARAALGTPLHVPALLRVRWAARPAYVAALAAVAVLALVAPRGGLEAPAGRKVVHAATPVQLAAAEPVARTERPSRWMVAVGLPMPRKPFDGQARPDKDGKCPRRSERNINGACWQELKVPAPCDEDGYEHDGACYIPVWPAPKDPSARR